MRKKWSKLPATKIGEVIDAIGRGGGGFSRSKPIKNVVKKSAPEEYQAATSTYIYILLFLITFSSN